MLPSRLDALTDMEALKDAISNWRAMLRHGFETGGVDSEGWNIFEAIEARLRTGRPLASKEWITRQKAASGRRLSPRKPGRKSGQGVGGQN